MYLNTVYLMEMPPDQFAFCTITVFVFYSSFICSTYLLIAMTFERFYSIIRPHKAASFNTVKRAKMIIASTYTLGILYSIPLLFVAGNTGRTCIPIRMASYNLLGKLYHWLTEIVIFVFPFISLVTMNSVIIHTLRTRSQQSILQSRDQGQHFKIKNSDKQIFIMLLVVTFAFLLLNTRSLVFYLNFYSGNTPYYYAGLHLFYHVGQKSYFTNHGINFFLYVVSGKKFRTDLRNLFVPKTLAKNTSMESTVKH